MKQEYICQWCGEPFFAKRERKYCGRQCQRECDREKGRWRKDKKWADRLHDGMRLLSDDFGEERGDESVTFQE